jgi:Flp pilus assembly pilin Flp
MTLIKKSKEEVQMKFTQFIKNLHREESGQDLLEYALVLAAVLVAVVAGSSSLATDINTALTTISGRIQAAVA